MAARFPSGPVSLAELCERFNARLVRGDRALKVARLAPLESATPTDISFLARASFKAAAQATQAGAVMTSAALSTLPSGSCAVLEVPNPYASYAEIARWISDAAQRQRDGVPAVARSADIHPGAILGTGCHIGERAVIGDGVVLGDACRIGAGSVIGAGTRLGAGCQLAANVTVAHDCQFGQRVVVHSGTVIGSDGFGFAPTAAGWSKIPQLGQVLIGDDVEIGANCAIDRGALAPTIIGNGCKLDNLIQIAHNVCIGEHTAIAGCVGIAGSAVIGARCQIGGAAGILGHLEICDDVIISAMSLVTRSIREPGLYTGIHPLQTNKDWERTAAALKQLPRLRERLRSLERTHGPSL